MFDKLVAIEPVGLIDSADRSLSWYSLYRDVLQSVFTRKRQCGYCCGE